MVRELIGVLAAIAVAGALYWWGRTDGVQAEREAWQVATAQAERLARDEARQTERERFRQREIVDANHQAELDRMRAAADGSERELGRLRDALASRHGAAGSDAATSGRVDGASVERELFGACAAAIQDMAGEADRIAGQLSGLQHYVTNVVAPAVEK